MSEPNQRHIVVVDTETTGFDPTRHSCIEVAWWDLNTGQRGRFVPEHNVSEVLVSANVDALRINRYIDRIPRSPQDLDGNEVRVLAKALDGHTLAGSNPSFDAAFLRCVFLDYERRDLGWLPGWHHRLWDLAPYAAGVLNLDHLPGLAEVRELLGIEARPDHTADGDVTVTGECLLELFNRTGVVLAP